ncbi:MAG: hypothetical protein F6K22_28300 [Okeania sp. SIO2F4]|uniref:DUF6232 family protein n=1 Tax=Okeania sp. SIO2F4 TaxID=2607790 RepID=UPI00142A3EC1|nr:DUF6232 family protein [Okeania sp. SIO2F4]NES06376.1 hypothetical protein [Okeania sp. SIO2F4]
MTNFLGNDKNTSVEKGKSIILVTKRTVRFGKSVYQTHNIAGFSEGKIKTPGIPWILLIIFMIVGLIILSTKINNNVGGIFTILAILGAFGNIFRAQQYGLLLTINSGDRILFSSTDQIGMRSIISEIYEFIESEKDATYRIDINNSSVSGNFVQGDVGGSVHTKTASSLKN